MQANVLARGWTCLMVAAMALCAGGCQQAYFKALNARAGDVAPQAVVFDTEHQLSLDLYPPDGARPAPVVVFLYGGSWQRGRRDFYRFVGQALAAKGVLVVIPDYRKAPRDPFPAFVEDAARAVAWTRANAGAWGGDTSRIFVMGHSAGAHIAALLGTDARYLERQGMRPRELAGIIGLAGPYDFQRSVNPRIGRRVFGQVADWALTQPVHFVDGDEPPFLLLHGDRDRRVWVENSSSLAEHLRAAGEPVTLEIVPGVGHIGLVNGFYSPRFSPALEETLDWMRAGGPAASRDTRLARPR